MRRSAARAPPWKVTKSEPAAVASRSRTGGASPPPARPREDVAERERAEAPAAPTPARRAPRRRRTTPHADPRRSARDHLRHLRHQPEHAGARPPRRDPRSGRRRDARRPRRAPGRSSTSSAMLRREDARQPRRRRERAARERPVRSAHEIRRPSAAPLASSDHHIRPSQFPHSVRRSAMHSQSRQRRAAFALRIGLVAALFAGALALAARRTPSASGARRKRSRPTQPAPEAAAPSKQPAAPQSGLPNFADLAEAAAARRWSTSRPPRRPRRRTWAWAPAARGSSAAGPGQGPAAAARAGGGQDPFHEFWEPFERFFGPMPRQQQAAQPRLGLHHRPRRLHPDQQPRRRERRRDRRPARRRTRSTRRRSSAATRRPTSR